VRLAPLERRDRGDDRRPEPQIHANSPETTSRQPAAAYGTAFAKTTVMSRAIRDALMSVGSVLILLSVLIAFDAGFREQVSRRVLSHPSAEVHSVGRQAHDLTNVIVAAAREQSRGHAPLLIFSLAAAVLVVFMLRT
jgi:hypothetical protein